MTTKTIPINPLSFYGPLADGQWADGIGLGPGGHGQLLVCVTIQITDRFIDNVFSYHKCIKRLKKRLVFHS